MRTLLRHLQTRDFFKAQGHWTKDPTEALNFDDSEAAIRVALELRLQDVEIYMCSDDGTPLFGSLFKSDP